MLDLTQRALPFHLLNDQRVNKPTDSKKSTLQHFATRLSAAVSSASGQKTPSNQSGVSSIPEPGRSNSVMGGSQRMLALLASRNASAAAPASISPLSTGSKDARDGTSDFAGQLTASGAPSIVRLTTPIANQWGYSGEAAFNPYFRTPSNPLGDGVVIGFSQWFEQNQIVGPGGNVGITSTTTKEGAEEALRLVHQYAPNATLSSARLGASGGPWLASKESYEIVLPSGGRVDAGLLLQSYYNQGRGVTPMSDSMLQLGLKST